jgi:hypothetical protein
MPIFPPVAIKNEEAISLGQVAEITTPVRSHGGSRTKRLPIFMDLMTTERVSQGLMGGNATYMPHRAQGRYPNQVLYADNMLPCNVMYTTNAVRVAGGF